MGLERNKKRTKFLRDVQKFLKTECKLTAKTNLRKEAMQVGKKVAFLLELMIGRHSCKVQGKFGIKGTGRICSL